MKLALLSSISGLLGAFITFAFGGWSQLLTILMLAVGIDYVSGVLAAIKSGKGLCSSVGFWGLARKGLMLLVILLAHHVDVLLGLQNVTMSAAIYFYLTNELISIAENYSRIGLPMPAVFSKIIKVLKEKEQEQK